MGQIQRLKDNVTKLQEVLRERNLTIAEQSRDITRLKKRINVLENPPEEEPKDDK